MATIGMYTADVRDLSLLPSYSGATISSTYSRTGTYSYALAYNQYITLPGGDSSTIYFKTCLCRSGEIFPYIRFRTNTAIQVAVKFYPTGIEAFRYITSLGSVATTLHKATWYCIEIKVVLSDTVGEVTVKIDGAQKLNLTSKDTIYDGDGTIDDIMIYQESTDTVYVDDIVIDSSAWPGVGGLHVLVPSGAGNYTNWTPSTGSNYECVNENPPTDDTDYVSTDASVTGTKDSYAMGNLSVSAHSIPRVGVFSKAKLDASGSGNLIPFLRSNSTDDDGDTTALSTSWKWCNGYWDTDPGNGDIAWTDTNVNALEAGIKT